LDKRRRLIRFLKLAIKLGVHIALLDFFKGLEIAPELINVYKVEKGIFIFLLISTVVKDSILFPRFRQLNPIFFANSTSYIDNFQENVRVHNLRCREKTP
jgi:hypothetical protein